MNLLLVALTPANALVVVLVLVFLTIPPALLLLDKLQPGSGRQAGEASSEEGHPTLGDVRRNSPGTAEETVLIVPASEVPGADGSPRDVVAFVPQYARITEPVDLAGDVYVGTGAEIAGDVTVQGRLVLGHGARLLGNVDIHGDLSMERSSRIRGRASVEGAVEMGAWARIGHLDRSSRLVVGQGARIDGTVRADRVERAPTEPGPGRTEEPVPPETEVERTPEPAAEGTG